MIVDLVRADLTRCCTPSTVKVDKFMEVESYKTVHQLVSTIIGKLGEDRTVRDALHGCFPGGSMTGAPKKRTMSYIRELEGSPRGVYSGSIGFIGLDGTCSLNICIRTAVIEGRNISVGCGGAITALSEEVQEWEEMMTKGRVVRKAVGVAAAAAALRKINMAPSEAMTNVKAGTKTTLTKAES